MLERSPRFDLHVPAKVQVLPEGQAFDADVLNVSERGLLLTTGAGEGPAFQPDYGTQVGIEVPAAEDHARVAILAEVRWRADDRFGVKIVAMAPHHSFRFLKIVDGARRASVGRLQV